MTGNHDDFDKRFDRMLDHNERVFKRMLPVMLVISCAGVVLTALLVYAAAHWLLTH